MAISAKKRVTNTEEVKRKVEDLAKEKGKVTYDDLNAILPEDTTSDEIDELMVTLGGVSALAV